MTDMPCRVQRKRTKGWRMPPNTVYVGRPTKWGNVDPFWGGPIPIAYYRRWLLEQGRELVTMARRELRGKNLACWCPLDQPCHADVLLEIANEEA